MNPWPLTRGQVIRADIKLAEPKLFVVVSNNRRNKNLGDVLTVQLTTSAKPDIPSVVELGDPEAFVGRACCDNLGPIYRDEVLNVVGALTPGAMKRIDAGIAAALDLTLI